MHLRSGNGWEALLPEGGLSVMPGMSQEQQGMRDSQSASHTAPRHKHSAQSAANQPWQQRKKSTERTSGLGTGAPRHHHREHPQFPDTGLRASMSHFNIPPRATDIIRVPGVNTSRGTGTHLLPGKNESLLLGTILNLFV